MTIYRTQHLRADSNKYWVVRVSKLDSLWRVCDWHSSDTRKRHLRSARKRNVAPCTLCGLYIAVPITYVWRHQRLRIDCWDHNMSVCRNDDDQQRVLDNYVSHKLYTWLFYLELNGSNSPASACFVIRLEPVTVGQMLVYTTPTNIPDYFAGILEMKITRKNKSLNVLYENIFGSVG
jgi:hypothetical protein